MGQIVARHSDVTLLLALGYGRIIPIYGILTGQAVGFLALSFLALS